VKIFERRIRVRSLQRGVTIIPFACVHWDHPGFHETLFKQFIERVRQDPIAWTIGLGDYLDFARQSYRHELRKALPAGDEDSQEHLDYFVADRAENFISQVSPIKSRCIGLIDGNHNWVFLSTNQARGWAASETLTAYIARRLSVPYLGYTAVVDLLFENERGVFDKYTLFASHGYGMSGTTAASDLGAMERKVEPAFSADCMMTAHTHRRLAYFLPEIEVCNGEIMERSHLLIKAGAFLKAYLENRVTYAERKLYRPLDLGWVEIHIEWRRSGPALKRYVTVSMQRSTDVSYRSDSTN